MAGIMDIYMLERELASKTTSTVKRDLKSAISATSHAKTGEALKKASSRSVFKHDRLQRIAIKAPYYIFMQNYGFEGSKSNGVNMRLKETSVIAKALDTSNILNTLADGISEIRLSQVSTLINFSKNGR